MNINYINIINMELLILICFKIWIIWFICYYHYIDINFVNYSFDEWYLVLSEIMKAGADVVASFGSDEQIEGLDIRTGSQ